MNLIKYVLILNFITLTAKAEGLNLHCTVNHNSSEVLSSQVHLPPKVRNLKFGEYGVFKFFLSDNSSENKQSTELQIFDGSRPTRSYAVADLTKSETLELTLWAQEYLLTVICKNR